MYSQPSFDTNLSNPARPVEKEKPQRCLIKRCNLCEHRFLARSRFDRFCLSCKEQDDLYHFHETMPSLSEVYSW